MVEVSDGPVDLRKERGLRLGDRAGRGVDDPGAGLAIGPHEAPGHVGPQPLAGGGQAGERAGPDGLADRGHHVPDPVVLELLRGRTLLVDVVPLALAEGLIHLPAGDVDGVDGRVVEPPAMAGKLEHGQRLPAVVHEHPLAAELVPGERRIRARAVRKKPSFSLIWAKCTAGGRWPFSSGPKP